jgi:hypothetical protein
MWHHACSIGWQLRSVAILAGRRHSHLIDGDALWSPLATYGLFLSGNFEVSKQLPTRPF